MVVLDLEMPCSHGNSCLRLEKRGKAKYWFGDIIRACEYDDGLLPHGRNSVYTHGSFQARVFAIL